MSRNVRTTITNFVSLAVVMMALAVGQVLFKWVGLAMRGRPLLDGFLLMARQPALYAALAVYGLATLVWIWILSRVPLMQAYPWVAATTAIVPLLGWFVFGERVGPIFWLGIALILVGMLLTQLAAQTS
jgi:drug/metabolite transporter (DMT)-like permease